MCFGCPKRLLAEQARDAQIFGELGVGAETRRRERNMEITRVMKFADETAREYFAKMHAGLVIGGTMAANKGERKTFEIGRKEARILRKMKAISFEESDEKCKRIMTGDKERVLNPGDQTLTLSQDELEFLVKMCESVPWATGQIDLIVDMVDFIGMADKADADALKAVK